MTDLLNRWADRGWRQIEGIVIGPCTRSIDGTQCGGEVSARDGGPYCDRCGSWREPVDAGRKKLTQAQRAGYRTAAELNTALDLLGDALAPRHPACHSWPLPMMPCTIDDLWEWQDDRCAICGRRTSAALVEDHDHKTGLTRGLLCVGCNGLEAESTRPAFVAYRAQPPTTMLGIVELYTGRNWTNGVPW